MKHEYAVYQNHIQTNRPIYDSGLALCTVCGGLEGGRPSECPGRWMSLVEQEQVYRGGLDFVGGQWAWKTSLSSPAA